MDGGRSSSSSHFGGSGNTIGGSGGDGLGGSVASLSAEEIRQRRLVALGGGGNNNNHNNNNNNNDDDDKNMNKNKNKNNNNNQVNNSKTNESEVEREAVQRKSPQFMVDPVDVDDDEDAALQAALAMSLEKNEVDTVAVDDANKGIEGITMKGSSSISGIVEKDDKNHENVSQHEQEQEAFPIPEDGGWMEISREVVEDWWKTAIPMDISSFHQFMWDSGLTTDNDKSRWVGQGIDTCTNNSRKNDNAATNDDDAAAAATLETEEPSILSDLVSDHGPWGLTQTHGGPCGVLAAIQAELLRLLLFGKRNPMDYPLHLEESKEQINSDTNNNNSHNNPEMTTSDATEKLQQRMDLSPALISEALAKAIAIVLARAAIMPSAAGDEDIEPQNCVRVVLPVSDAPLTWEDLEPWNLKSCGATNISQELQKSSTLRVYTISPPPLADSNSEIPSTKRQKKNTAWESQDVRIVRLARAVATFLLQLPPEVATPVEAPFTPSSAPLASFRRPGGVILLVMSLVSSRGAHIIQGEMDDPVQTKLTAQFGHCGQELINLLLTGQAVSNVFDNTLTPSGELTCRGIQLRPSIGYLSQLEALRYCEVGGYYKSPRFPIWVVGSTSHFTVLFGDASCLKETASDLLLEKCRRAFKAVEGGEENGFIASQHLSTVLKSLNLDLGDESAFQALAASLEVSDAGIILWDAFWKATSRLLTGASLEHVLQGTDIPGGLTQDDHPPLLITQFGEDEFDRKPSAKGTDDTVLSGWDSPYHQQHQFPEQQHIAPSASPMQVDHNFALSDEELARKLQAEYDAELSGNATAAATSGTVAGSASATAGGDATTTSSDAAVDGSPPSPQWKHNPQQLESVSTVSGGVSAGQAESKNSNAMLEFEKYGDSFPLYHYNGLREGTLTPFRVTRLSAEEAVGASIALNRSGGGNAYSSPGGGACDLENVIRTKWPSCMINWLGKSPPYID